MKIHKHILVLIVLLAGITQTMAQTSRTLYLVRHAKSSHEDSTLTDFERPLGERGINDAPLMGKRLCKRKAKIDLVIASPSRRTTQTLELLLKQLDYPMDKVVWDSTLYLSSLTNLVHRVNEIDDEYYNVILCGHNPSMTDAANYFQKDTTIDNVVTTGVVAIQFEGSWKKVKKGSGKYVFFDFPKKGL